MIIMKKKFVHCDIHTCGELDELTKKYDDKFTKEILHIKRQNE